MADEAQAGGGWCDGYRRGDPNPQPKRSSDLSQWGLHTKLDASFLVWNLVGGMGLLLYH